MSQGSAKGIPLDTDVNLAANSDELAASQKAVKAYIGTVAATKQNADADLSQIAGLTPANNDFMIYASGNWSNLTPSQAVDLLAAITGFGKWNRLAFKTNSVVTHTGTLTRTLLYASGALPALAANDFFRFYFNVGGTSNANSKTFEAFFNSANTLDGNQQLIGTFTFTTGNNGGQGFVRNISFESISSQRKNPPATSNATDEISGTSGGIPATTNSVDFSSGTWYFLIAATLGNTGDTMRLNFGYGEIKR